MLLSVYPVIDEFVMFCCLFVTAEEIHPQCDIDKVILCRDLESESSFKLHAMATETEH